MRCSQSDEALTPPTRITASLVTLLATGVNAMVPGSIHNVLMARLAHVGWLNDWFQLAVMGYKAGFLPGCTVFTVHVHCSTVR